MDITLFGGDGVVLWPNKTGRLLDYTLGIFDPGPIFFSGARTDRHKIAGTVTVDGQPAERIVVAFDRRTLTYLGATLSDPKTGEWEMPGLPELPEKALLVIGMDTTGNYNAEVADYITQVATV